MKCLICGSAQVDSEGPDPYSLTFKCKDCGRSCNLTADAIARVQQDNELEFALASWVYEKQLSGISEPHIDCRTLEQVRNFTPTMQNRIERYLGQILTKARGRPGHVFSSIDYDLRVASSSYDNQSADQIALYLESLDAVVKKDVGQNRYSLLVKGCILNDEWSARRAALGQGFVAMWFDPKMTAYYEDGFQKAIEGAGYVSFRIDKGEHAGKIDDAIIAEIRRSAFVVADFTGQRGGVYYEAGFAHGLGKSVIFTCLKTEKEEELHFDVRQYNTIFWDTVDDLIPALQNRILAIFGAGPNNSDAKPILKP